MPRSAAALEALPGIGRYTANAIASICYGEPVAVLDGNVMRVLARLDDIAAVITERETQATLWQRASDLLPSQAAGDHNQAMMELGRTICRPRNPSCLICPVRQFCGASAHGTQAQRPVKAARSATPHYDVAAGVIWNDKGEILIAQRKAESLLGGLWEFPGGKQEAGETLPECLLRELREELAIEISVGEQIATVKHAFTHFKITLYAFCCQYQSGEPQAIGCAAWQWVQPEALDQFAFGKADREVIKVIKSMRST
jgi:A/G-specific adenine glycosylase